MALFHIWLKRKQSKFGGVCCIPVTWLANFPLVQSKHPKQKCHGRCFPLIPFVINWLPSALDCGKMKLSLHGLCVQFRGTGAKWVLFVPEPSGEQRTAGWCVFSVCTHCSRVAVKCHTALYIHFRSQDRHVIKERTFQSHILRGSQRCCQNKTNQPVWKRSRKVQQLSSHWHVCVLG